MAEAVVVWTSGSDGIVQLPSNEVVAQYDYSIPNSSAVPQLVCVGI